MSSEIYYDKAFISIGDKYIPLVCHGSNNTYEFNRNGREVAPLSGKKSFYKRGNPEDRGNL